MTAGPEHDYQPQPDKPGLRAAWLGSRRLAVMAGVITLGVLAGAGVAVAATSSSSPSRWCGGRRSAASVARWCARWPRVPARGGSRRRRPDAPQAALTHRGQPWRRADAELCAAP